MSNEKKTNSIPADNFKMGRGMGPNLNVEKPKNAKNTLQRLVQYFAKEKPMLFRLLTIVVFSVLCSVYAPSIQSNAIDQIFYIFITQVTIWLLQLFISLIALL